MKNSEYLRGVWGPEQLAAADAAYAEVTRIIYAPNQSEREHIARLLLKMTEDERLEPSLLAQRCIEHLYPLNEIATDHIDPQVATMLALSLTNLRKHTSVKPRRSKRLPAAHA